MTNTRRDHDEAARHILEIQEQMQAVQTQLNEQQRTNAEALGAFQTSFQAFQVEVRQWMRAFTLQGAANPPPASTVQSPARAPAQVMEQGSASMNRPPRGNRPVPTYVDVVFGSGIIKNSLGMLGLNFLNLELISLILMAQTLEGEIDAWFEGYMIDHGGRVFWDEFTEDVCKRFSSLGLECVEEEFKLLRQTELYFIRNYISGLKGHIRCFVKTANPLTLMDAYIYARQFEEGLKEAEWMGKGQTKVANNSPGTSSIGSWSVNKGKPMVQLSQAELEKLKEQKLCFYCREKWQHGHKCKPKAFNVITGTEEGEQEQKPTRKSSYCNAVEASSSAEIMDSRVKDLLSQYEDVFSEPQGLPPTRMHDHAIPLVANANPVNLKAYSETEQSATAVLPGRRHQRGALGVIVFPATKWRLPSSISGEHATTAKQRRRSTASAFSSPVSTFSPSRRSSSNDELRLPPPTVDGNNAIAIFQRRTPCDGEQAATTLLHRRDQQKDGSFLSPTAKQSSQQQQSSPVVGISVELSASLSSQQQSGGFLPLFPASMRRQRRLIPPFT
nr:uncharacterized protein LOC109176731 [Ipomoea batatas]